MHEMEKSPFSNSQQVNVYIEYLENIKLINLIVILNQRLIK